MIKRILHTGTAVPDIDEAVKFYESLGFEAAQRFHKPDLDAEVAMMVQGEACYEIFQFNNPDHPQVPFIRTHIALYSDSLETDVDAFIKQGYKLTIPITEGVIYRFAYLQDASGINYEIATEKTTT